MVVQKIFGGSILGVSRWMTPKNIKSNVREQTVFEAQKLHQKLDFGVLPFKRGRAYKKVIAVRSKLVRMKGYLKTYSLYKNHVNFLSYLRRFRIRPVL